MQKVDVNKLTGFDFFKARNDIGMTIGKTAEMTGINRNNLSKFEQEKGTLTSNEKRTLKRFYEERGYDFGEPGDIDGEDISMEYQANKAEVSESIQAMMPNETGEALVNYIDAVHDVLTANGYLDDLTYKSADEISYVEPVKKTKDSSVLFERFTNLKDILVKHFTDDKAGQHKGKTGFFAENAEGRGEKLMALCALEFLRILKAVHPELIELSYEQAEADTDMKRLLEVIKDKLEYVSLRKDLPAEISPELVA